MESEELTPSELLHLAETHLRVRNHSLSSQYALESLHSPSAAAVDLRLRAHRILAISDVLSAADSYSVLGVDTFCSDITLIRSKFKSLLLLLDPIRSSFPPADTALKSAWNACNVLGSLDKKSELDAQIMAAIKRGAGKSEGFWTFCPYCYFLYEYDRAFEGFCLRCQNVGCRRAFEGVSIRIPVPVGMTSFSCFAYFPLGFSGSDGSVGGRKFGSWSPFVGVSGFTDEGTNAVNEKEDFVEISDDSEDSEQAECVNAKKVELSDGVGNGGNFEVDGVEYGFGSEEDDMQFVQKDGEIFLELPPDDEDL